MLKTKLFLALGTLCALTSLSMADNEIYSHESFKIVYKDLFSFSYEKPIDLENNSYKDSQDEIKISKSDKPCKNDTTKVTNIDVEWVNRKFANGILKGKGQLMVDIAKAHNISPHFFIALIAHESNYGRSRLARTKNNFGGLKASKRKFKSFNSPVEGLTYMARLIQNNYHGEGRISVAAIHQKYCPGGGANRSWGKKIVSLMNTFHRESE